MNTLATEFKKSGVKYIQLERVGDVAIYHRSNGEWSDYEVIRVQSHDGYEIGEAKIPPGENYPGSNSWGTNGFTFTALRPALDRFHELTKA